MNIKDNYRLYTIGYEGKGITEFVNKLQNFGVEYLIDIREQPVSRVAGFSKNTLAKALEDNHIHYLHFRELGSPKDLRQKFKADQDEVFFFEKFSEYLIGQSESIEKVYDYVSKGTCCLMCVERSPLECHRSIVAKKIKERDGNGLIIYDI